MKPSKCLMVLNYIFLFTLNASVTLTVEDYSRLILDLYHFYKPSSVTLMHFTDQQNFSQMNTFFNMQGLFSKERIATLTINSEEIFLLLDNYTQRFRKDTKPMNIIFLKCKKDIITMSELSKNGSLRKMINIVLFVKADEDPLLEFCMNPRGNPFFLNEDESLLVKCYENTIIQEWYPSNTQKVIFSEKATWEPKTGLVLKSANLFYREGIVLNGKFLRTARLRRYETWRNYFNNLCLALEMAGNFSTRTVKIADDFGSWDESNKTWSGAIGLLVNDEVDLVVTWFPINHELPLIVDFSVAIIQVDLFLHIKEPSTKIAVLWTGYFKPFTYSSWYAIIIFLKVSVILLTVLRSRQRILHFGDLITDNFLIVWGSYCQQCFSEFPKASSLRIFYSSIFTFGFLLLSIYSACFLNKLTAIDANLPFKSVEEFLKIRSHKMTVIGNAAYDYTVKDSSIYPRKEMVKFLMKRSQTPKNTLEALKLICRKKVALYTSNLISPPKPCHLVQVPTGEKMRFAMILRKNSPYTKAINYYITKLKDSGVLNRIESAMKLSILSDSSGLKSQQKFHPVTVLDIALLLVILLGSIVFSIAILFFEKVKVIWI